MAWLEAWRRVAGIIRSVSKPTTPAGVEGLAAIARDPRRALLAFDFDGVVSPIVDDPEQAQASPRVLHALSGIGRLVGAVAIITGRPVSFLTSRDGFGELASIPGFTVYGHYGRERWSAGAVLVPPASEDVAAVRTELTRLLDGPGEYRGVWLEDKGSSVAVHTRRAADPLGALAALEEPVRELALRHKLRVEPGKLVLEIRPDGVHKGDVLRGIARERAAQAVLYAGDDLGDLSAFAAVDDLRADGIPGIKVCSGSPEAAEVAEAADIVVDGPDGVADLLESLARQIEGVRPVE
jgi:trehalose 6-phosphate phosphatase